MKENSTKAIKGIYVSPMAIVRDPEYASRITGEYGVNLFVIRCGFDPAARDAVIGDAVEIVSRIGAGYWLLAGTWWGKSSLPQAEEMISIVDKSLFPAAQAFEAQFPMKGLGGSADALIAASLESLCKDYSPGGICLTHARFRSPAHLPALFEYSTGEFEEVMHARGITPERLSTAFFSAMRKLSDLTGSELVVSSREKNVATFLDWLAGDRIFTDWFELRESVLVKSILSLRHSVKSVNSGEILFGSNVYDPFGAELCGQSYERLIELYDFVQPLLSYMLWHIYEPVAAWGKLLLKYAPQVSPAEAVEASCNLFNLDQLGLLLDPVRLTSEGEGAPGTIANVISRAIKFCKAFQNPNYIITPVVRGRDWPSSLSLSLSYQVISEGFEGVVFQGTQAFAGKPPGDGWY